MKSPPTGFGGGGPESAPPSYCVHSRSGGNGNSLMRLRVLRSKGPAAGGEVGLMGGAAVGGSRQNRRR